MTTILTPGKAAEPRHHLSEPLLLAYAAGTLPEAFSLVVASHLSLCDDCRARAMALDEVGGAILSQGSADLSEGALERAMALLGPDGPRRVAPPPDRRAPQGAVRPARAEKRRPVFPAPLAGLVGDDPQRIAWSRLGGGVRQFVLPLQGRARARLLYIPAGKAVPSHGHRGTELTLVLQGAFYDETARFARGDVEIASQADEHQPIAEMGEDCICLAATDAPLRFASLVPRLLQPFFRI